MVIECHDDQVELCRRLKVDVRCCRDLDSASLRMDAEVYITAEIVCIRLDPAASASFDIIRERLRRAPDSHPAALSGSTAEAVPTAVPAKEFSVESRAQTCMAAAESIVMMGRSLTSLTMIITALCAPLRLNKLCRPVAPKEFADILRCSLLPACEPGM